MPKKKRGRKSAEDEYMEHREELFHEEFNGVNPTYAPMLVRVKRCGITCEDCGEYCANGREKEKKLYETGGKKNSHWRERCLTCNKAKNPFTGKYDLSIQQASYVWAAYLRETKGMYKTTGNTARKKINEVKMLEVKEKIETDTETITFYSESSKEK